MTNTSAVAAALTVAVATSRSTCLGIAPAPWPPILFRSASCSLNQIVGVVGQEPRPLERVEDGLDRRGRRYRRARLTCENLECALDGLRGFFDRVLEILLRTGTEVAIAASNSLRAPATRES